MKSDENTSKHKGSGVKANLPNKQITLRKNHVEGDKEILKASNQSKAFFKKIFASRDTAESIIKKISEFGPFLPGSIRKTKAKYQKKDGSISVYDAQPIYTLKDPMTGKFVAIRVPNELYDYIYGLTKKYKGMQKLYQRLEYALIAESISSISNPKEPQNKKK